LACFDWASNICQAPASGLGKPKPKEKAKEGGRPAKKVGIVRSFFDANSDGGDNY
jgi:hypothetical protein